jgi:N-acetylglucosaminyl-diphospho-decaprenol L-rhamnosyltransferase
MSATVIVPTVVGGPRLVRMLESLDDQLDGVEVLVVDNGSADRAMDVVQARFSDARVIRLDRNAGYSRAINLAARQAATDALVLLNDDCVCDPGFVKAIVARLDPAAGVTMVAGVMRESRDRSRIDTAGVEIDRTLLAFDYLNGEPVKCLDQGVPDPIGPSGGAAAVDRDAFLAVGGFDENLFAYLEDVDLVLRMRLDGGSCRLAADARGVHEHSSTLQSGSASKDYLMGFGRGYMLRKWGVLSAGRLPSVLARELAICAGQAVVDRNLAGVRGRVQGLRSSPAREPYPSPALPRSTPTLASTLTRRWRRRARLRAAE